MERDASLKDAADYTGSTEAERWELFDHRHEYLKEQTSPKDLK